MAILTPKEMAPCPDCKTENLNSIVEKKIYWFFKEKGSGHTNRGKALMCSECEYVYGVSVIDGYLKFSDKHIEPILEKEKTLTARYGLDRKFDEGEIIDLLDSEGRRFCKAKVLLTHNTTVENFVNLDFEGHKSYSSVDEFINELSNYYPNSASFEADTSLKVIHFEIISEEKYYVKEAEKIRGNSEKE